MTNILLVITLIVIPTIIMINLLNKLDVDKCLNILEKKFHRKVC